MIIFLPKANNSRLKTKSPILRFITIMLLCQLATISYSQNNKDRTTDNFNINLELKNMHLWHGAIVTPGATTATSLEFNSTDKKFIAGLWGGASFNGEYKEFSYYTTYRFMSNFNVSLISHNNYSNSKKPNIFCYDKFTSPNFIDIVLQYTISEKVPLTLYWSTILLGGGQDFETNTNGSATDSYSTYVELRCPILQKQKTKLTLFTGGAFSPTTDKTFYSSAANIINFGINADRNIPILAKNIPVSATAFWNPETKLGALQLSISLF